MFNLSVSGHLLLVLFISKYFYFVPFCYTDKSPSKESLPPSEQIKKTAAIPSEKKNNECYVVNSVSEQAFNVCINNI